MGKGGLSLSQDNWGREAGGGSRGGRVGGSSGRRLGGKYKLNRLGKGRKTNRFGVRIPLVESQILKSQFHVVVRY